MFNRDLTCLQKRCKIVFIIKVQDHVGPEQALHPHASGTEYDLLLVDPSEHVSTAVRVTVRDG